jgi:hypothetical protein
MWNIQKLVSKGDYNYAVVPKHPHANKSGYVLEHRVVMENHLGRLLNPDEIVHHVNGKKKDNRLENLEIMSISEHARYHGSQQGVTMVDFICPNCGVVFVKTKRNTLDKNHSSQHGRTKLFYCSKSCSATFEHLRKTYKLHDTVSVNILQIYKDNTEVTD